ncbi:hypothetical protein Tco_0096827 [Tanacetum coccineum]
MAKSSCIIENSYAGFEERVVATLQDGKCIPDGPTPPVYLVQPLIASSKNFSLDAVLPEGLLAQTTDKGLWLLGCLPMVAWPLSAEQKMNRVVLRERVTDMSLRAKAAVESSPVDFFELAQPWADISTCLI